ncbi:MAG: tRNA adenosine(34) deaminase TadA, partial [Clostridia bacterium]|nr:tRNA adenosine(34) deaminase TadA [Clostridia bacterium]
MEEKFMLLALDLAKKAQKKDEVPIGAVIVREGKVIAKAFNLMEKKQSATSHAEIIAINKACKKLKSWRLLDCEMYVTLEPCSMCAGALINSRIKKLYIGADDNKTGACGSVLNLLGDYKFNHTIEVKKYILKEDSEKLLKEFFKFLRERNKS